STYNMLPPASGAFPLTSAYQGNMFFYLLPFIEQQNIHNLAPAGNSWATNLVYEQTIKTYLCPSDATSQPVQMWAGGWAAGNYVANYQVFAPNENPGYSAIIPA